MKARRGELIKLSGLFDKYAKLLKPPQRSVEKIACEVIVEVVGITLRVDQVAYTVSTRTLYVKAPALLKSEVRLRRNEILAALRAKLPQEAPEEIL